MKFSKMITADGRVSGVDTDFGKILARFVVLAAGLRPYTPDHRPIISEVDGISGLYVASGHEGDGIGLAPITGVLVRDMVLERPSQIPLEPLSLRRFA